VPYPEIVRLVGNVVVSRRGDAAGLRVNFGRLDENYIEAKRQCANSRTSLALQRMIQAHAPEQHFFGRYHRRWTAKRGATTFGCLKEMEVCEA
jgi:hypothetical protein